MSSCYYYAPEACPLNVSGTESLDCILGYIYLSILHTKSSDIVDQRNMVLLMSKIHDNNFIIRMLYKDVY